MWLTLTAGVPPEPSYDELLRGEGQPGPHEFLRALFRELANTGLGTVELFREEQGGWLELARGYCGTPEVGYAWDTRRDVSDSSIPLDENYVTYGLPDVTLLWSVSYRKRGQLGYASWQSGGLAVRLAGGTGEVLGRLWTRTFGPDHYPVFAPVPPEGGPWYEDRVRRHLERHRADLQSAGGGESASR
jgi:hypothetical protein